MGWFVYILKCADDTLYTGITTNCERRLNQHNAKKGAKYTRVRTPVTMVYQEPAESRSSATQREIAVKKLTRGQKLQMIEQCSQ